MGQANAIVYDQDNYIRPNKIHRPNINPCALTLDTVVVEQMFGVCSIPASHRAVLGEQRSAFVCTQFNSTDGSRLSDKQDAKENQYLDKISRLENEVSLLKSLVLDEKYSSRKNSPVKNEVHYENQQIKEFKSRLRKTYFE